MKILIAYFSASGVTKSIAEKLKEELSADIFEIEPVEKYSSKDLNWLNPLSRSSREMHDKNSRPEIKNKLDNFDDYQLFYVGFPVWWYTCPHIINNFFESYDFKNKEVKIFFTSGSTKEDTIIKSVKNKYEFITNCKRLMNDNDIKDWINNGN